MKLLPILFVVVFLIVPSARQDSPELKEASDLTESVVKLIGEKSYGEALAPAKRALEIRERLLPRNDPRIGNSLIYLIDIYTAKRDFGKAKELLIRLLQHQTERFGGEHVKLAPTLERLGVLHYRDGDNSKAEDAYKQALALKEKEFRSDPRIGNSLIYLIDIYTAKRDFGKAKELLIRLLQHQTERFGGEHVKLAPTLERLGVLHYRDGDNSKAEDAYKQALALKEKEFGTDHVEVAHTLFGLAELYRALRDFDRAAPVYRRTLRLYAKHSGVLSADFERAITAYGCFGYEINKEELYTELQQIWYRSDTQIGTVLNGKALSLPKPDYPEAAREHQLAGRVTVKVRLTEP